MLEDLWKTLAKNANRLIDLFRKWDLNGDGKIDRKEWQQAIPLIGIRTTTEHIDRVRHGPSSLNRLNSAEHSLPSLLLTDLAFNLARGAVV